jgi:glycosyltransferase involved in cell wall biosynthesis
VNILHVSEADAGGGAAILASRLHRGLRDAGHRSRMLVGRRLNGDADVRKLKRSGWWRGADRAAGAVLDRLSLQYVFYPSSFGVVRDRWFREADVLQLHNLHGSYFAFTALPSLARRKPTVWLLHDQWAMTGHVAYPRDCSRWRHGCGSCPYLHEYPRLERDTTGLLWRLKRWTYERCELTLVVPSRWLERLVGESPLLSRFPVRRILHGLDTGVFRPRPREEARSRLGLPPERRIVLFAATDLNEPRKGLATLVEALRRLEEPPLLALAGAGRAPDGVEVRALGSLDEDRLVDAYCAADALAVPTVADVLTQTAPEAISCGTPCVSFDDGGVTDVVVPGETGYRARFGDVDDLARRLREVIEQRDALSAHCRAFAERELTLARQVREYTSLYEELAA